LLGPFILILRLILCLDQLYSCKVILLSSVNLYDILLLLVHALCLAQFAVQIDTTYTHSWCTHFAWISCAATHLYFSPASVNSWTVYSTALYNCTLASAWPLFCQPITEELRFTCFALIGPLSISTTSPSLIVAC
jgi:hypothetical protein